MKELAILKKPLFWFSLILILLWGIVASLPDKRLHLVFCDVGQGDAILVSYGRTQVLIDGGPDNKVSNCLSKHLPFWDRQIEMVVLTHADEDHFVGLIDVFKRYNVRYFVANSLINSKASFWQFYQLVLEEKASFYSPKVGEKIKIGNLEFLVLWPKERLGNSQIWRKENLTYLSENKPLPDSILTKATFSEELNDTSIVLQFSFGQSQALLTGDITEKVESQLDLGKVEVLKVAHHGSKFSTSEEFLSKIKPKLAIISVGENRFGHPAQETLERLDQAGIKVLRTDREGNIEIVSNGWGWYNQL
jgi:competence protein ComEC